MYVRYFIIDKIAKALGLSIRCRETGRPLGNLPTYASNSVLPDPTQAGCASGHWTPQ